MGDLNAGKGFVGSNGIEDSHKNIMQCNSSMKNYLMTTVINYSSTRIVCKESISPLGSF